MGRGVMLALCAGLWGCPAYLLSGIPAGRERTAVEQVSPLEGEAALRCGERACSAAPVEVSYVAGRSKPLFFTALAVEGTAGIACSVIGTDMKNSDPAQANNPVLIAGGVLVILAIADVVAYIALGKEFDAHGTGARLLGPAQVSWNGRTRPLQIDDVYRNGILAERFSAKDLMGSAPARSPSGRVAVLEFENQVPAPDSSSVDRVYFSDQVRGALSNALPSAVIMTRENTLQLLSASGKRLEDCAGECEVDTGRMLGADYVVSGRLTKVGTRYKLTLRLHATAQGTLVSTAAASGETMNQLDDDTPNAVRTLIAGLSR